MLLVQFVCFRDRDSIPAAAIRSVVPEVQTPFPHVAMHVGQVEFVASFAVVVHGVGCDAGVLVIPPGPMQCGVPVARVILGVRFASAGIFPVGLGG